MGSTKTECIEDTQISVRMNSDDVLVWKKCYKIREVWGRYAPDTAANWSEFLDVPGSLGSLRSSYCRELVRVPGCSWKSGVATLRILPRIFLCPISFKPKPY